MSNVIVYRNGYLEVSQNGNCFNMRYYRNEKINILKRSYKGNYENALNNFKKVIDTEGF